MCVPRLSHNLNAQRIGIPVVLNRFLKSYSSSFITGAVCWLLPPPYALSERGSGGARERAQVGYPAAVGTELGQGRPPYRRYVQGGATPGTYYPIGFQL